MERSMRCPGSGLVGGTPWPFVKTADSAGGRRYGLPKVSVGTFCWGGRCRARSVVAVVGVCGTLASAIFSQRLSQRTRFVELEHSERVRLAEQGTAEKERRTEQLRSCYVQLNANDRNYRDAMLAYAYALKAGSPGEDEAAEVAAARRAQRNARAEAQMIVSEEVLNSEGRVNAQLTVVYSRLQHIQGDSDPNDRELLLQEVIELLDKIILLLSRARVTMRMDLGVIDKPPAWY